MHGRGRENAEAADEPRDVDGAELAGEDHGVNGKPSLASRHEDAG